MIEQDLFTALTGHAGLSALVSDRIYPLIMPQPPTFPAVVYQKISGPRDQTYSGPSGLANPRFQVTVWAQTYAAAKQVAEQVRLAMTAGIPGSILENELDRYEADTSLFGVVLDFRFWHLETTA